MIGRLLARIQSPDEGDAPAILAPMAAAVLLIEVAWADHQISDAEITAIKRALRSVLGLSNDDAEAVIVESWAEHRDSVGLQRFTRALVEAWSLEQRCELLVQLWRLAYDSEGLDKYEEATIRKIADLLYVDHGRYISAKLKAKRLAAN